MDRRIGYLIVALLAALLFFLGIGYHGWPCAGSVLGSSCRSNKVYETTGALLLTAGLLIVLAAVFLIVVLMTDKGWSEIAATVFATLAGILAIAGVFYYMDRVGGWSPFLSTIAMSMTVALAAILLFDFITAHF